MQYHLMTAIRFLALVLTVGAVGFAGDIQQVCNCNRGGGGRVVPYAAAPYYDSGPDTMMVHPAPMMPGMLPGLQGGGGPVAANPTPPPGTLGRTYSLPARPVPADKHPRVGMLEVKVSGTVEVFVGDTFEFRESDDVDGYQDERDPALWHFETKPLTPGQPHVYRIETRHPGTEEHRGDVIEVRYVRLVPGRVLMINF